MPDHTPIAITLDSPASPSSDRFSSPIIVSATGSRQASRTPSPFVDLGSGSDSRVIEHRQTHLGVQKTTGTAATAATGEVRYSESEDDISFGAWNDETYDDMPSDLRPSLDSTGRSRSQTPLLAGADAYHSFPSAAAHTRPPLSRRSTLHERDPDLNARAAQRKKWIYASFFLVLSLVSFTVQTETAVYIQHHLKWNKAYCMLYLTHGSWSLLWPFQLCILRLQKRSQPFHTFLHNHLRLITQTAQMVRHRTLHLSPRHQQTSPWPYIARTTAYVTCALTVAGGSWYIAVDYTTASDLTAIYNCSAFFAYVFSVPLLHEKIRLGKVVSVVVAIAGVLVVAYGDKVAPRHSSPSGGGTNPNEDEAKNRSLGNILIGIGSVLYGLYEVLYKKVLCPPEGCSAGRSMIFANTVGSCIGAFTLLVLWVPLPILHWTGIETFQWPTGETAGMLFISVLCNATFSGSFLILMSLTSPVLSSVAALLTIFIVALVSELLPPPLHTPLSGAAIVGGLIIIGAFLMLSWSTWKEMEEERAAKELEAEESGTESESLIGGDR